MSFHPSSLTPDHLHGLAARFQSAYLMVMGQPMEFSAAQEALALALDQPSLITGRAGELSLLEASKINTAAALAEPSTRKLLWRLLASQLSCGLSTCESLETIRANCDKMGLSPQVAQLLDQWQIKLKEGVHVYELIAEYVLPFDFNEGATLMIGSRLGSFNDILDRISE